MLTSREALATGLRLRGAIHFDDDRERIADERIRDSITSFTLVTCGSRVAGREPSRVALEVTHGGDRRRALRQFGSDAGGVPWRTDRDRRRSVPLVTRIYGDPVGGSTSADQPSHQAHHTDSGPRTDPRSAPGPPEVMKGQVLREVTARSTPTDADARRTCGRDDASGSAG